MGDAAAIPSQLALNFSSSVDWCAAHHASASTVHIRVGQCSIALPQERSLFIRLAPRLQTREEWRCAKSRSAISKAAKVEQKKAPEGAFAGHVIAATRARPR